MSTKRPRTLKTVLRRFTNMASLIHILQTRKITLLNPASWDDKNDAHFMAEYKRKIDAQTVLALCFTESKETYHHWRVFSGSPDGVCIDIYRKPLVRMLEATNGVKFRKVSYELVEKLGSAGIRASELPFVKREPYTHEMEYRAIYVNKDAAFDSLDIDIELAWIKSITLSPWIPVVQKDSVINALNSIPGCERIQIGRSTLIENMKWREIATNARID